MLSNDAPEMIANHTLAHNIITRHNTPHEVLDAAELDLLKRFCLDPSSSTTLLESEGVTVAGRQERGSLVGYCISRHTTADPALLDTEIANLRGWFESEDVDITGGAGPMIRSHTLAYNLIMRPFAIFEKDSREFRLMQLFCADPSTKNSILENADMLDEEGATPGTRAQHQYGSLTGYCIALHGTEKQAMADWEIELLRDWFANGGPEVKGE